MSLEPAAPDAAVEVTPPLATAPPGDYALSFDGLDDYVEVPSLKHAVNSPMTVEAICRIVDLKRSTLVDLGSRETSEFVLRTDAQQWRFERSAGSRWISTRGSQSPKPGPFVHIAGVWDGSRLWLFIDGVLQPGSNTTNQSRQRTQLERLLIGGLGQGKGRQTDPPTELFGGAIKALRISDMARYTSRFTAPADFDSDEHTLALYHFDEGVGDVLKDSSGNGHDGKIFGATWVKANGEPISMSADYALSFDGQDDYVATPIKLDVTQPFTAEAYVTASEIRNQAQMALCNTLGAGFGLGLRENGKWRTDLGSRGYTSGYAMVEANDAALLHHRTHLSCVYDGTETRLYIDGKVQNERQEVLNPRDSPMQFLIAANPNGDGTTWEHFLGTIDEVRISNIARYTENFSPATRLETDEHTLALYHFDQGVGDVLTDSSGNGHDGKIFGATWVKPDGTAIDLSLYGRSDDRPKSPVATSDPKGDSALSFDGQSYVSTPVDLSVEKPFTIEAWAAPASWEGSTLFSVICNAQRAGVSLELRNFEMLNWGFSVQDQQGYQKALSSSGPERGRPVHLAGVFDGSHARLFVNGELMQSEPVLDLPLKPSSLPLLIGANPQPDDRLPIYPFNGTIDEVRFSDVARYTNDFTPATRFEPDAHTLALYHFDEGSGDVLKDVSGNGHDGKIVGATWVRVNDEPKAIASSSDGWHGWPGDAPPPAIAPFDAEQAQKHQQAWANYLGVPVEYENSIGMKFRLIPPGEFLMGATEAELTAALSEVLRDQGNDPAFREQIQTEGPPHRVILTQPFYLSTTEVVQLYYEKVVGSNRSNFSPNGIGKDDIAGLDTSKHPVEMVNWIDVVQFCVKLGQQETLKPFYFVSGETVTLLDGVSYRLPTEAEWEFACRAGTTSRYWSGDEESDLLSSSWSARNSGNRTHAVGELRSNPFGLWDMHGNVNEWMQDGWDSEYHTRFRDTSSVDPTVPFYGNKGRVVRGGNWASKPFGCRSSTRRPAWGTRDSLLGFRVVLPVNAVKGPLNEQTAAPDVPEADTQSDLPRS